MSSLHMLNRDYRVDELRGLSLLGLCLVIAASHVAVINNFEPFNFEMVFNGKFLLLWQHESMTLDHAWTFLEVINPLTPNLIMLFITIIFICHNYIYIFIYYYYFFFFINLFFFLRGIIYSCH